jgi:hypothetical protein
MNDFLDEVREDIRRERLESAWKKTGVYILTFCALLIAAAVGNAFWQSYRVHTKEEQTGFFLQADEKFAAKNWAEAVAAFENVASKKQPLRILRC